MSSYSYPRISTFLASGAVKRGQAVKIGADREHVAKGAAATDKLIGLAQNETLVAEESVEVAGNGGGGVGLAGGTIAAGDLLTSDANGSLIATTTANNRVVAVAMEAAVAGQIFAVEVALSNV